MLNVNTGKYDTAEALMRLNLEKTGIVYPNQFIHLAEEQGYIHMLTEIILTKPVTPYGCLPRRGMRSSGSP